MFIDSETNNHSVKALCKVVKVSRFGYYAWLKRPVSKRKLQDEELKEIISDIFATNRSVYGVDRILICLKHQGVHISARRCSRLMGELQIQGVSKRKKRPHTKSENPSKIAH